MLRPLHINIITYHWSLLCEFTVYSPNSADKLYKVSTIIMLSLCADLSMTSATYILGGWGRLTP